jgi:hypothetical protein
MIVAAKAGPGNHDQNRARAIVKKLTIAVSSSKKNAAAEAAAPDDSNV